MGENPLKIALNSSNVKVNVAVPNHKYLIMSLSLIA